MTHSFAIADVAALVGDASRASMLVALMDGGARAAGELARCAQITPAAASMHLGKLTLGGLLAVEKQGRHRYYRLANDRVGSALEALGLIASTPVPNVKPLSARQAVLRHARTCYDHLAGTVAVAFREALEREGVIQAHGTEDYILTTGGAVWLREHFDIEVDEMQRARRATARQCLDWTERRPHIAGALGAALLTCMRSRGWVVSGAQSRALRVTDRGRVALQRLGVSGERSARA